MYGDIGLLYTEIATFYSVERTKEELRGTTGFDPHWMYKTLSAVSLVTEMALSHLF